MRILQIPFVKFLIMLAVVAVGIYWLYAISPPQALATSTFPGAMPEYRSDLRNCFAEAIRIDGARTVVKQAADIERFNRMVDVYNKACGNLWEPKRNFAAVEAIRSEVRANRERLWAEGIARITGP